MADFEFLPEHIGLAARDSAALAGWYQRVLGAKVEWCNQQEPPAFLLRLGEGSLIEVYPGDRADSPPLPNSTPGWRHLALRVPSIESARQVLEARGVEFTESVKPAGGGGRVQFFRDLEGNLLHLVERPGFSGYS